MGYKWCAVPECSNTSIKTPDKLFVCVPRNLKMRRKWMQLARRNSDDVRPSSNIFFCEDHFNKQICLLQLQQDMANYYQYKMGLSMRILMVDKAVPSKFDCQSETNKIMYDAFVEQQRELIQERRNDIELQTVTNNQYINNDEP